MNLTEVQRRLEEEVLRYEQAFKAMDFSAVPPGNPDIARNALNVLIKRIVDMVPAVMESVDREYADYQENEDPGTDAVRTEHIDTMRDRIAIGRKLVREFAADLAFAVDTYVTAAQGAATVNDNLSFLALTSNVFRTIQQLQDELLVKLDYYMETADYLAYTSPEDRYMFKHSVSMRENPDDMFAYLYLLRQEYAEAKSNEALNLVLKHADGLEEEEEEKAPPTTTTTTIPPDDMMNVDKRLSDVAALKMVHGYESEAVKNSTKTTPVRPWIREGEAEAQPEPEIANAADQVPENQTAADLLEAMTQDDVSNFKWTAEFLGNALLMGEWYRSVDDLVIYNAFRRFYRDNSAVLVEENSKLERRIKDYLQARQRNGRLHPWSERHRLVIDFIPELRALLKESAERNNVEWFAVSEYYRNLHNLTYPAIFLISTSLAPSTAPWLEALGTGFTQKVVAVGEYMATSPSPWVTSEFLEPPSVNIGGNTTLTATELDRVKRFALDKDGFKVDYFSDGSVTAVDRESSRTRTNPGTDKPEIIPEVEFFKRNEIVDDLIRRAGGAPGTPFYALVDFMFNASKVPDSATTVFNNVVRIRKNATSTTYTPAGVLLALRMFLDNPAFLAVPAFFRNNPSPARVMMFVTNTLAVAHAFAANVDWAKWFKDPTSFRLTPQLRSGESFELAATTMTFSNMTQAAGPQGTFKLGGATTTVGADAMGVYIGYHALSSLTKVSLGFLGGFGYALFNFVHTHMDNGNKRPLSFFDAYYKGYNMLGAGDSLERRVVGKVIGGAQAITGTNEILYPLAATSIASKLAPIERAEASALKTLGNSFAEFVSAVQKNPSQGVALVFNVTEFGTTLVRNMWKSSFFNSVTRYLFGKEDASLAASGLNLQGKLGYISTVINTSSPEGQALAEAAGWVEWGVSFGLHSLAIFCLGTGVALAVGGYKARSPTAFAFSFGALMGSAVIGRMAFSWATPSGIVLGLYFAGAAVATLLGYKFVSWALGDGPRQKKKTDDDAVDDDRNRARPTSSSIRKRRPSTGRQLTLDEVTSQTSRSSTKEKDDDARPPVGVMANAWSVVTNKNLWMIANHGLAFYNTYRHVLEPVALLVMEKAINPFAAPVPATTLSLRRRPLAARPAFHHY